MIKSYESFVIMKPNLLYELKDVKMKSHSSCLMYLLSKRQFTPQQALGTSHTAHSA